MIGRAGRYAADRLLKLSLLCAIGLTYAPCASAQEEAPPTWKQALPGMAGYLGDDGGGSNTDTVCDTAALYERWVDIASDVSGCHTFPRGIPVILGGVVDGPALLPGNLQMPSVQLTIPSRHNYTGFTKLLSVQPIIPIGIAVNLPGDGSGMFLAPAEDSDFRVGVELTRATAAKVLRIDPATASRGLFVRIAEGPHHGQEGWVFSSEPLLPNGDPVNAFAEAIPNGQSE